MDTEIEQQSLGLPTSAHTKNKTQSNKLMTITYVENCQIAKAFILHRAQE